METILYKEFHITLDQQRGYLYLPFDMTEDVESLTICYDYARYDLLESETGSGLFSARPEINVIDLGLIAPDGEQIGASGSDKSEIFISEASATLGYRPGPLTPGEWKILVGAYKVAPEGVTVHYHIQMIKKRTRLLKGDLHTHTLASDGVLTAAELGQLALRHGLDFIAVTDHNQMATRDALPRIPGLTLIPGGEWTHYLGHANFLGVDRPYDGAFAANTPEEIRRRFETARQRGAFITLNHPFEECCPFTLDFGSLPFDCLEIWNGPMREANLKALAWWQGLLVVGHKIPICGGSDFHRATPFIFLGGPTTCVYAESNGPSDILAALKRGRAYITFAPDGPSLEFTAGEAMLGDSVRWEEVRQMEIVCDRLQTGDVVQLVTARETQVLVQAPGPGRYETRWEMPSPGFARVEVLRAFLPGLPPLPALISNPIYFD